MQREKGLVDSFTMRSICQVPAAAGSQPVDHYIYLHLERPLGVKNRTGSARQIKAAMRMTEKGNGRAGTEDEEEDKETECESTEKKQSGRRSAFRKPTVINCSMSLIIYSHQRQHVCSLVFTAFSFGLLYGHILRD